MKNSYSAAQVFAIADTKTFILGMKPISLDFDAILGVFFFHGVEIP